MLVYSIKCGLLARMSTRGLLYNQVNLLHANRSLSSSTCRVSVFPASSSEINSLRRFHKAVVENVPENATKEMLSDYFSKFGTLISAERVQNVDKPEFHVVFEEHKEFNAAVYSLTHVISNKPVTIRPFEAVRIAISNLPLSTTEESLHAYFSGFGKVIRCNLRVQKKGGFYGVVNLYPKSDKAKKLFSSLHVIGGQQVKVKQVISTELKHYVSDLSPSTTTKSLADFYSQFGGPLEVKLSQCVDRNLYYGVVHFSSQEQVDAAIQSLPHVVDGNEVVFEHNTKDFTLFARLPPNSTQEGLQQYFEQFGPISKCIVTSYKSSGDSAWVTFRQAWAESCTGQPTSSCESQKDQNLSKR
uniref:RRM domain-containing protein n=1 Tax=Ditylenchus dipsaci TaxID=166011 RepID=A0A915CWE0_9BILA